MKYEEILNKTINILQKSLDPKEILLFSANTKLLPSKERIPYAVLSIKAKNEKSIKENIRKESIEKKLAGENFVLQVRITTEPRFLRSSISYLKKVKEKFPDWNPLIIAPYIGPSARSLCRSEGVSYVDTLGNIGIFLENIFVLKESKESLKTERKELKSLFSLKSTRMIRILLENPSRLWLLKDIASYAQVSLGQAYNVVKKLVDEEYAKKTEKGIKISRPSELMERWGTVYKITDANKIESFYFSEPVYKRVIKRLAEIAEKEHYSYAFTLFAGASLIIPYVRTPQVHLYFPGNNEEFVKKAGLKPVTSGGNVHLIFPYDNGIFNPIQKIEGVKVVGNIQLYLDLLNYPARGKEQAEVLREKIIGF